MVTNCPSLEILDLSECRDVDDECVKIIATSLPRLSTLKLNKCELLTEKICSIFYEHCPELRVSLVYKANMDTIRFNLGYPLKIYMFVSILCSAAFPSSSHTPKQNVFIRNCNIQFNPDDHFNYMSNLRKVVT